MEVKEENYLFLKASEENRELLRAKDKCDKYDYIAAVVCGAIGGMIDIFLVGAPGDSSLESWTDSQVDHAVKAFARKTGWNPRAGKEDNAASAIGFLERTFKVNYDQRHSADVGNAFSMNTKNHHMMSLAHSPDIVGLFFSLLNQFTSTSSFAANGKLIFVNTDTCALQGGNFLAKLFCGIANWFGHIMSDIAGSSGSRGNSGRGAGVVAPFYELFQFCKFGKFSVGKDKQDFAEIAIRAFQEGYDFRFGLAAAVPVIVGELSIRLVWALRWRFQYGMPLKECIPTSRHADLRIMLLLGNGTLCVMDGIDAGVRSGGNFLAFFMRLNLIAWYRFTLLVLKEVCIRIGLADALTVDIEAYKRINEELLIYLRKLETIDKPAFERETEAYHQTVMILNAAATQEQLNAALLAAFDKLGFQKPWNGDFDRHMSNKNERLVFE